MRRIFRNDDGSVTIYLDQENVIVFEEGDCYSDKIYNGFIDDYDKII